MLKSISIIIKRSGIAAFALMAFVLPGTASAIVVNGIMDGENNFVLDSDYVDYYAAGTHHSPAKTLDYKTQTGSEFFELDGTGNLSQFSGDLCFGVQGDGGNCKSSATQTNPDSNDDLYWQTSLDYLARTFHKHARTLACSLIPQGIILNRPDQ